MPSSSRADVDETHDEQAGHRQQRRRERDLRRGHRRAEAVRRSRARRPVDVRCRPAATAVRTPCIAGNRPNSRLVASPSTSVNVRTVRVDPEVEHRAVFGGHDREQRRCSVIQRDGERAGAAEHPEQGRFDQQQPNHPAGRRAERQTHGHLGRRDRSTRASRRLATFAQAMASTKPVTANISSRIALHLGAIAGPARARHPAARVWRCWNGCALAVAPMPLRRAGYSTSRISAGERHVEEAFGLLAGDARLEARRTRTASDRCGREARSSRDRETHAAAIASGTNTCGRSRVVMPEKPARRDADDGHRLAVDDEGVVDDATDRRQSACSSSRGSARRPDVRLGRDRRRARAAGPAPA